jgi:uncharacterized protein with HEPN domain
MDETDLAADIKSLYSVVRCLEIVSEASRRLRGVQQSRFPDLPWRKIEDAGNVYRHGYDRLLVNRIWETLHHDMPVLSQVADTVLSDLPKENDSHLA